MENILQKTPPKRDKLFNVPLVIICQSVQAFAIGSIALFLPLIRKDLEMTFTQGGTLATASTSFYALMQIPAGYLADRLGGKRLFAIGVLGTTVLAFCFGLTTEYWQAVIIQSLSGIFRAFVFAPGIRLLSGWFPPEKRAMAMGLFLIGGLTGNVIIDIFGPMLVVEFGWRIPFLAFSPVGITAALVLWRFGKEPPASGQAQKARLSDVFQLFKNRLMWVCGAIQYIRLAVMMGTAYWLPTLFVEEKGISLQVAGLLIALRAALTAPSNVLGGYLSDRLRNPTGVIAISLTALMVTTALFVVVDNFVLLVILVVINSIFVQMYFGPLFSIPVEVLGERTSGTSTGFGNLFANIGSLTCTFALGALKDSTGSFFSGFIAVAVACIIGLGFTALLARMRRRALQKQSA